MCIEQKKKKKKKTFHLLFGSILRLCLVCIWVLKSSSSSKWEAHKALQWSTWLNCVRYTTIAQGEEIRKNEVLCYLVNFTAFWHYFRGTFALCLLTHKEGCRANGKLIFKVTEKRHFQTALMAEQQNNTRVMICCYGENSTNRIYQIKLFLV